jgi:hypothetical protein
MAVNQISLRALLKVATLTNAESRANRKLHDNPHAGYAADAAILNPI